MQALDQYPLITFCLLWKIQRIPHYTQVQSLNYLSSFIFTVHYLIVIITKFFYNTLASEQTLSTLSRESECWASVKVMSSVWPAAQIEKLARYLSTNLSIRGCRLLAQNFPSQLSFYINYSGNACEFPKSLAAEFKERPSGVMSKKLGTQL